MSAKIVCPATRKNGPVVPPMIHRTVKHAIFGERDAPIEHEQRTTLATRYVVRRPIMVLIGSQINPERAMAMKTPALAVLMSVTLTSKPAAISTVAGMMAVLQKVIGSGIQQTTKRMTHFRQDGSSITSSSMAPTGGRGSDMDSADARPPVFGSGMFKSFRDRPEEVRG
ncbi:hypothetical protein QQX98_002075 [Neonectria punicea]|uniref:Uncharacterized protein n=1 Tax=Neonectria punicea TaxID=979145 RepID=A0ABR1HLK6_9HYPO